MYIAPDSLFDVAKDGRLLIAVPEQAGIIAVTVVLNGQAALKSSLGVQFKSISGHPQTSRNLERKRVVKPCFWGATSRNTN